MDEIYRLYQAVVYSALKDKDREYFFSHDTHLFSFSVAQKVLDLPSGWTVWNKREEFMKFLHGEVLVSEKQAMYSLFRQGFGFSRIAKIMNRSSATVYSVIQEMEGEAGVRLFSSPYYKSRGYNTLRSDEKSSHTG